jgi:hypothetical protein
MKMPGERDSDGDSSVDEDNEEGMGDIDLGEGLDEEEGEDGEERKEAPKKNKKKAAKESDDDDHDS